ncbi:MAG: hypothetical protein L0Y64_04845 [Myxococcaceae bacterium]|nr:hypothetical protein [Myxococcaceae bacterium]
MKCAACSRVVLLGAVRFRACGAWFRLCRPCARIVAQGRIGDWATTPFNVLLVQERVIGEYQALATALAWLISAGAVVDFSGAGVTIFTGQGTDLKEATGAHFMAAYTALRHQAREN